MPDSVKHLLLVEDEAPLRAAIAEQLTDRGYHVEQAGTGEAALAKLADFAFDVIITDLRLPGIDGSAVIDAALDRYPDIVAIVVTGYGTVTASGPQAAWLCGSSISSAWRCDKPVTVTASTAPPSLVALSSALSRRRRDPSAPPRACSRRRSGSG